LIPSEDLHNGIDATLLFLVLLYNPGTYAILWGCAMLTSTSTTARLQRKSIVL